MGNSAEKRFGLGLVQTILQVLDERSSVDRSLVVEGEAEIFGEGALARAIEAGHPDSHFVLATSLHGHLHAIKELAELLLDALRDHIFRDFSLQPVFLGSTISDDLLDRPINVLGRIK